MLCLRLVRAAAAILPALLLSLSTSSTRAGGTPLGTAFTYQGLLRDGGQPANGQYDLQFKLWNDPVSVTPGDQIGVATCLENVQVSDGLFTVALNAAGVFGPAAFNGEQRYLEIAVRAGAIGVCVNPGGFTTLAPRQPITATPYALQTRGILVDAAGNVGLGATNPQDDLHIASGAAALRLEDTTSPGGGFTQIWDAQPTQLRINKVNNNGLVLLDLSPKPADGVSNASVRLFRETNTTGAKSLQLHRGNNTSELSALIGVDGGDSFLQAHGGNVGIGSAVPVRKLDVVSNDDSGAAIQGRNVAIDGHGILGWTAAVSGFGVGVDGFAVGANGTGVRGYASSQFGATRGVVGISASPNGYDFLAAGAGEDYGSSSSIRWKRNIELIDDPLDKIAALRGVYFDWDAEHGGQHDVGMIAEEVGKVLPEIVAYEENGIDANGMDYSKLTPLLVEAVKALRAENDAQIRSQQERIESQAQIIERQQAAIDDLLQRIRTLERRVAK